MNIQCHNCFEEYDSNLDICPYCGYMKGEGATEALHMNPGTILHGRYHIGKVLGFGGFGVTYLAWDEVLESRVAIKEYLPSEFSTRAVGVSQITIYSGNKEQQFRDGMGVFNGWTSSQTIYIEGYTEAPSGWYSYWKKNCDATIVWDQ